MKKIFINGGIFALSLVLPAIVECRKYNNPAPSQVITASAIIIDTGPVAADGCGWLVKIGSASYHPTTLDSKYQVDNLKVNISYEVLSDKYQCGLLPVSATNPGFSVIHITKITTTN